MAKLQLFCKPLAREVDSGGLQMCCNVCGLLIGAFPNAPDKAQSGRGKTKSISSHITELSMRNL
jgi:hypothetical protein